MLEDKILNDYKQAMKNKDAFRVQTLSFLRAQLKNAVIDKKVDKLADADVIATIKKQVKQRQDSIEQFEKGGRTDLAENEKKELDILKSYLPKEMPPEELQALIAAVITEVGASTMKDMGKVMKAVQEKVAGRADGKMISQLVKDKLS